MKIFKVLVIASTFITGALAVPFGIARSAETSSEANGFDTSVYNLSNTAHACSEQDCTITTPNPHTDNHAVPSPGHDSAITWNNDGPLELCCGEGCNFTTPSRDPKSLPPIARRGFYTAPQSGSPADYRWPREGTTSTIWYCFANPAAQTALYVGITHAVNQLMAALGGPPSASSGHRIQFRHMNQYCYRSDYRNPMEYVGTWNPLVPEHYVTIHLNVAGARSYQSVVGYWQGGSAGRHRMLLTPLTPNADNPGLAPARTYDYVHELLHVLGLLHEHQRRDRNQNVVYKCENVRGYARAMADAAADPSMAQVGITTEAARRNAICTNEEWAKWFSFEGSNFVIGDQTPGRLGLQRGPYDFMSIMQYSSFDGANQAFYDSMNDNDLGRPDAVLAPLYRQNPQNPNLVALLAENRRMSPGDVANVKALYPF